MAATLAAGPLPYLRLRPPGHAGPLSGVREDSRRNGTADAGAVNSPHAPPNGPHNAPPPAAAQPRLRLRGGGSKGGNVRISLLNIIAWTAFTCSLSSAAPTPATGPSTAP